MEQTLVLILVEPPHCYFNSTVDTGQHDQMAGEKASLEWSCAALRVYYSWALR